MEYCDLGSLDMHILKYKNRILPTDFIRHIIKETLNGVHYLHNKMGICHRDLKPENIMLKTNFSNINPFPLIKIGDFGISKHLTENNCIQTIIGTSFYIAPEIPLESKSSFNCDFWSLGVMYYEIKTGEHPLLRGNRELENCWRNQSEIEYILDEWKDDVIMMDLIKQMLIYSPEKRITWKGIKESKLYKSLFDTCDLNSSFAF